MLYERRHPDFDALIDPDASLEQLATGYKFVEGPAWDPKRGHLTFSDIAGDAMFRWRPGGGPPEPYRRPSRMANGNTYDPEGRLLTCEHASSRLVREQPDGSLTVLASHHGEKELNSPNDVIVTSAGVIWFTDPLPGRKPFFGVPRAPELDFQGVWRLRPGDAAAEPIVVDFELPNGVCTNPEETLLYVNDTPRGHIRRFALTPDGALSGGEIFARLEGEGEGVPDGLKTDTAGRVWCTGPGGVHVFAPSGQALGVIRIPEKTANFTWFGADRSTLVTTSSTSLYTLPMRATGHHVF